MKFKQYILSENLTVTDALKIFGVESIPDEKSLKNLYKTLANKNHPDLGGSVEKMQAVNSAYELLKKNSSAKSFSTNFKVDKAKQEEIRKGKLNSIKQKLNAAFDLNKFTEHFQSIFGETFFNTVKERDIGDSVYIDVDFYNKDRKIVLSLNFSGTYINTFTSSLAGGDTDIDLYISTEILYNRKKIKIKNSRYTFSKSSKILSNPEEIFPKSKILSKKDSKGKFSKKDAILIFESELNADVSYQSGTVWARVPIFGDYILLLYRTTFMGSGAWGINGVYEKNKKLSAKYFGSYFESEETFNWLADRILELKKINSLNSIEDFLIRMYDSYKANFVK